MIKFITLDNKQDAVFENTFNTKKLINLVCKYLRI